MSGGARHLPITLITSIKMVISPVVSVGVSARAEHETPHHPTLNLKVSPNPKLSVYRSMW